MPEFRSLNRPHPTITYSHIHEHTQEGEGEEEERVLSERRKVCSHSIFLMKEEKESEARSN